MSAPTFLEKTLHIDPCPSRAIKTPTLQFSCRRKGHAYTLHAVFSRHPMRFPGLPGSLSGYATGDLTLQTSLPQARNWQEFLRLAQNVRGNIRFHDLSSPVLRNLEDIYAAFSEGVPGETLITGSIGALHHISGVGADGRWNVQLSFTGIQMERHLPSFWSLFPVSITGHILYRFPQDTRPTVRVLGFLTFIPPLFEGRPGAVIRNREAFDAPLDGRGLHLHEARLDISGNEVVVNGVLSPDHLELGIQGELQARKLQFLYPTPIAAVEGEAILQATIQGDPLSPQVEGFLRMNSADLAFGPKRTPMRLSGLRVQLSRRLDISFLLFGQDRLPLSVSGGLRLLPARFDNLRVEGVLPNEILTHFGHRLISDMQGRWRIGAAIDGPLKTPRFKGDLSGKNLEFRARGMSENVAIQEAALGFDENAIEVRRLKFHYAGGDFGVSGRITDYAAPHFDLHIAGNAVPYAIPEIFQSEFTMNLYFRGPLGDTELSGKIDLVSGRYIQQYDVIQRILTIHRFRERPQPIWQPFPKLGKTRLAISLLNTGELEVRNNVATLQLDGLLALAGTLENPRLQGQLTVNSGTFKIPFLRGVYDVDEGVVDFDVSQKPFLNIRGTATVEDLNGDEVLVRLHLRGPADKIDFTLSSFPEMEQGQIVMLLAAGRTVEDIRSAWRGSPRDGTGISSGKFNPIDYYDESIKQVTGDFLSMLVANPIKMVTRLDLLRLELGSDSFQVRAAKTFWRHVTMKGEVEVGFLGRNRQEGGLEIRIFDNLRIEGVLRRYVPDFQQYEYEDPLKGRVELRYRMKFRGDLQDVFGIW